MNHEHNGGEIKKQVIKSERELQIIDLKAMQALTDEIYNTGSVFKQIQAEFRRSYNRADKKPKSIEQQTKEREAKRTDELEYIRMQAKNIRACWFKAYNAFQVFCKNHDLPLTEHELKKERREYHNIFLAFDSILMEMAVVMDEIWTKLSQILQYKQSNNPLLQPEGIEKLINQANEDFLAIYEKYLDLMQSIKSKSQ